jgi:hypothetical protein
MQQDDEDRKNEIVIEGFENKIKELEDSLKEKDSLLYSAEGSLAVAHSQNEKLSKELEQARTLLEKNSDRFNRESEALNASVGAKAKTPPFARCLHRPRCTNGDKTTGRLTLRPIRHRTKTCDEVISSCDLVQHGGPRVIRPIVTGPAWPMRITSLICKGIPVITVCNPALWEYSGDNLGV